MVFADDGKLVGFKGEIIHSLNKNANFLKGIGSDWAHDETRKHIILVILFIYYLFIYFPIHILTIHFFFLFRLEIIYQIFICLMV